MIEWKSWLHWENSLSVSGPDYRTKFGASAFWGQQKAPSSNISNFLQQTELFSPHLGIHRVWYVFDAFEFSFIISIRFVSFLPFQMFHLVYSVHFVINFADGANILFVERLLIDFSATIQSFKWISFIQQTLHNKYTASLPAFFERMRQHVNDDCKLLPNDNHLLNAVKNLYNFNHGERIHTICYLVSTTTIDTCQASIP